MDNNLSSLNKLKADMEAMKYLSVLLPKEQRRRFKEMQKKLFHMERQISLFNERFLDHGWCAYDSINFTLVEKANSAFENSGLSEAEKVLTAYYKSDVKDVIHWIKASGNELMDRYDLIQNAFEDHFSGRYYASIPLFLIIVDGAVNDFTKSKGFFAEGTELTAWDCLVGCTEGLAMLKTIFNKGRGKTNNEPIFLPYRNGILHGRDLNYANEFVSCKCVALLFAVADWMKMKSSENNRKEKFKQDSYVPPFSELLTKTKQNNDDKYEIQKWTPSPVRVGIDIPESGSTDEYANFPYLIPFCNMFHCWKSKNYGTLSILLKNMFKYEKSDKKRAGECRDFFASKEFENFRFLEIEERGCSLVRVLLEAEWTMNGQSIKENLEFGCVYQNEFGRGAFPWRNEGNWVIMPWNVQGLYKLI